MALGFTPRKSLTYRPWAGPPELMRHYWRGMVDGDGSIGKVATRSDWWVTLTGSQSAMIAFADWANRVCAGHRGLIRAQPHRMIWRVSVVGKAKPRALALALYARATIFLPRKAALALDLMD